MRKPEDCETYRGTWIDFVESYLPGDERVTRRFLVTTKDDAYLGLVVWFGAWRCYGFYPGEGTVFEHTCLREIALFCEKRTIERKAERKAAKA